MRPAERKLFDFLLSLKLRELNDWEWIPSRGEQRQQLEQLLRDLKNEDEQQGNRLL